MGVPPHSPNKSALPPLMRRAADASQGDSTLLRGLPYAAPDWEPLEHKLYELLSVVPYSSPTLERTTVLTWIYKNHGMLSFEALASRMEGLQSTTEKKKSARRALRNLAGIGAITLQTPGEPDSDDEDLQDVNQIPVGRHTVAMITREGMNWMRRAFTARLVSTRSSLNRHLRWVHDQYLEEEEGKGTDPHWIDRPNNGGRVTSLPARAGEFHNPTAVSSVFDLSRLQQTPVRAKAAQTPEQPGPERRTTQRRHSERRLRPNND